MVIEKKGKSESGGRGFWGRILNIHLGSRRLEYEEIGDDVYGKFIGGIGLGAKVLWERMKPGVDPLGPENMLGFTTGLLTDTGSLFTGRFMVVGKSPATNGWGDANCGGYFSPFLKRCGIDAVFFQGQSESPAYLLVNDEGAEIKDGSDLWGLDTMETEKRLKDRHGARAQVACIGPAGEGLSFMAGVVNDQGRIAARGGLGAVMGSKKVKAIVAVGTQRIGVIDSKRVQELSRQFLKRIEKGQRLKPFLGDRLLGIMGLITRKSRLYPRQPADLWRLLLSKYGTAGITALSAESGDSPVRNWGGVGYRDFPLSRSKKIGPEAVLQYEVKKYGCYSCPLHCGGIVKVTDGPYPIEEMHKPEYESLCALGTLLLNEDLPSIFKINDLVNRAGMDTISCGGVLAFAVECFENGLLTKSDTDGLELRWGNAPALVALTEKIIKREGLGDLLADGVKKAAERIGKGSERFAVHCGGMEAPMHDPKFDPGYGISYSCEPTPGRHTISSYQFLDLQFLEKKFKRAGKVPALTTYHQKYNYENRGEAVAIDSFYKMLVDCAGACLFGTQIRGDIPLCEWMNAVTGWDLSNDDYLQIGERVEQLRHAFNIREGLNPQKDFRPHPRLYGDPPLPKGPAKGVTLDMEKLTRSFYQAMHWDLETARPEKDYLKDLGLDEVVSVLYSD